MITFYDSISGRFFKSTVKDMLYHIKNFNDFRATYVMENIELNAWYEEIGLPSVEVGMDLRWPAWDVVKHINMILEPAVNEEIGEPIIYITYEYSPRLLEQYTKEYYKIWGKGAC